MIQKGKTINAPEELPRKYRGSIIAMLNSVIVAMGHKDHCNNTLNSSILSFIKNRMKARISERI